jgi:hypothetical protein
MTDKEVEDIIRSNMNLQMNLAGIRQDFEEKLQRTWVGLTEERIKDIWLKGKDHGDDWLDVLSLARSFEAELKEKNT